MEAMNYNFMDLVAAKLHIASNNLMFTVKFLSDYWVYSSLSKHIF